MRRVPDHRAAPLAPVLRARPSGAVWERTYRFITPVFGGGVKVDGHRKEYDRVTPVRASAIRGQLRFWWRAVNPRRCGTIEALAQAEAEVFGRASNGRAFSNSALAIAVTKQPGTPEPKTVFESVKAEKKDRDRNPTGEFKWNITSTVGTGLSYGVFPLRDDRKDIQYPTPHAHGTLWEYQHPWTIQCDFDADNFADDLTAALWAWTHFGGLGARTRRGFGAIALDDARGGDALPTVADGWQRWKLEGAPEVVWPHLGGALEKHVVVAQRFGAGGTEDDAKANGLDAQSTLLEFMQRLRQGRIGRNRGGEKFPGRSFWPEADAIRRLADKHHPNHAPVSPLPKEVFPRGAFGTPIIFHFKDEGRHRDSDPQDSTLNPEGEGRLASPLILRPAFEDGSYLPRAVRLRGSTPAHFELQMKDGATARGLRVTLEPTEIAQISPLGRDADPITRYLNLLRNGR